MAISDRLAALEPRWSTLSIGAGAADSVYTTLREGIMSGALRPGDGLIEEQVARQFGISRTPVREALLKLESEGLAHRVPRRGLVVRSISEHELIEVNTVRIALDSLAARLAAEQALPTDISRLRWINRQLAEAVAEGELENVPTLTNEFHQALAEAARNSMLKQFIMQAQSFTRRFGTSTVARRERSADAIDEHERLVDAIEARNPELAAQIAEAHMSAARSIQIAAFRERAGTAS
ncbi:MAG TPA: GntR family transcriptional regulator [Chloroflexota bacterium]|jgi:DNA-binding GntR family transcriptional regulator|nr:GntR family transcriptional regulator [Chloroflexota bacterium]